MSGDGSGGALGLEAGAEGAGSFRINRFGPRNRYRVAFPGYALHGRELVGAAATLSGGGLAAVSGAVVADPQGGEVFLAIDRLELLGPAA